MTDHYDICRVCPHVFKPKRLTKQQYESRRYCPCLCHWGDENAMGITIEEAEEILLHHSGNGTKTE